MSTLAVTLSRPTLADRVFSRSLVTDIALIAAGVALTAGAAQLAIPLWPVPITMQTLAVLLVGSSLGAARGAASMALYLVLGAAGLPIFSDGEAGLAVVFGSTGGYIVGFVFAAALTGWLAQRDWDKKFVGAAVSFLAGTVVIFGFGLVGLALTLGGTLEQTLQWGLYPFIIGGIVKAAIAAALIPGSWKLVSRLDSRRK